jgi:selT/selW/selH-like putative selenoprotein
LQSTYGADVTLEGGARGAFEVTVNGQLIFSKWKEGRFPTHDEIGAAIEAL